MQVQINKSVLQIVQGDLTTHDTDAIVNAANSSLMGGGGIDGAIHRAGGSAILGDCKQIVANQGQLQTGKAVITTAGNMPSKFVIHTVGLIYRGGTSNESELLANAYKNSLKLATDKKLESISFPSISTGVYSYPLQEASKIALGTVITFLRENEQVKLVRFVLFDDRNFAAYQNSLTNLLGNN